MMNIKSSKMQEDHKQQSVKYQCIVCKKFFLSSQAIAGHTKIHFKDGWIKGTHQKKVPVSSFDEQQQHQQSSTDSSIPQQQQIFSGSASNTDSANAQPRHHLRLRDMKTLARLRGRLTKDEEKVVLRLLDAAREQQQHQGSVMNSSVPQQQMIFSGAASVPNSSSAHQLPPPPTQTQHKQQSVKYQCIVCKKFFLSSQAIAGHTKIHYKDGWTKGTHQNKVSVSSFDDQQQHQQSSTDSSTPQQQQFFSESTSNTDSTNTRPRHHLRLRDMKTIARLRGRLTKDEEKVILYLLDGASNRKIIKQEH